MTLARDIGYTFTRLLGLTVDGVFLSALVRAVACVLLCCLANGCTKAGWTVEAIRDGIMRGDVDQTVKMLRHGRGDVASWRDETGQTLVHLAVEADIPEDGSVELVRALLACGIRLQWAGLI